MKITDVTTTLIHNPDSEAIQDATIPPPKPGTKGRTTVFIHIPFIRWTRVPNIPSTLMGEG